MEYSSKGTKKTKDSNNVNKQLDKFYTNEKTVDTVIDYLVDLFKKNKIDISYYSFLEPCAGDGAFLNGLERKLPKSKYEAYDIAPEDSRIIKMDFLDLNKEYDEHLITIGNPPFGYKGDLAAKFINKCSEFGPIVIFVLPIQFRRYNIQKQLNSNLKLIYSSKDFPKKSFILEGKPHNVNCLFQIWIRDDFYLLNKYKNIRLLQPLPNSHEDFKLYIHNNTVGTLKYFNKDEYKWDFAVARQGFYDYSIRITDPSDLKQHVQYLFVKYVNPDSKKVFEKMDFVKLSHVNTSILGFSNTDVVAEYVKLKKKLKL